MSRSVSSATKAAKSASPLFQLVLVMGCDLGCNNLDTGGIFMQIGHQTGQQGLAKYRRQQQFKTAGKCIRAKISTPQHAVYRVQ